MTTSTAQPSQPNAFSHHIQKAEEAMQAGNLSAAAQHTQAVLDAEPNHVQALSFMAAIRLRTGAFTEADRVLDQALAVDDKNAGLYNLKGVVAYHAGEFERAVEATKKALALTAEDSNSWNNLGEAYRELGEWKKAQDAYDEGLKHQPQHAPLLANRSILHSTLYRYKQAEADAQSAAALMPDLPAVAKAQALCALNRMDYKAVRPLLEALLQRAPNSVEALLLLADVHLAEGRGDAAMELIEKALQAQPRSGEALGRMAACYFTQNKHDEAMEVALRAEEMKPHSPKVQMVLANGYRSKMQYDKAQTHLEKALEIAPDYAQAIAAQAEVYHRTGQGDKGYALLAEAISNYPHPHLYVAQGMMYMRDKALLEKAEQSFRHALDLQPDHARACILLGKIVQYKKGYDETLDLMERVLERSPHNAEALMMTGISQFYGKKNYVKAAHYFAMSLYYKNDQDHAHWYFIESLRSVRLSNYTAHHTKAIELCLLNPNLSKQYIGPHWLFLLCQHPELKLLRDLLNAPTQEDFNTLLQGRERESSLTHSFFLAGLSCLIVASPNVEQLAARLRRYAMLNREQLEQWRWLPLLVALAHQNFLVEYIAETSEEEDALAHALSDTIQGDSAEEDVVLLACYERIFRHAHAAVWEERMRTSTNSTLQNFGQFQLSEPLEEQRILPTIESLGETTDLISQAVQEQYEENPYPRWQSASKLMSRPFEQMVQGLFPFVKKEELNVASPTRVLIPGCGTGQQIAICCNQMANTDILAVDLSRASLAYAIRRSRELGLSNVTYRHADILSLPDVIDEKFDYIECAGVLHHMGDPKEGMRILRNMLKPTGFMKWGLYSEMARHAIIKTRAFIEEQGFPATKEGIKSCRKAISQLPAEHPVRDIMQIRDFYSLSDCRDLVFHVQETRYTLPELKEIMDELKLEFMGFDSAVSMQDREAFRKQFPDDEYSRNLDNWHVYEQAHPNTFRAMYQFWMRPIQEG